MYKVQSRVEFDAAHFLLDTSTPCDVLHGHRWSVDVILKSERLTKDGFVVNFVTLKQWMKEMTENLDHNLVNFYMRQPTAENMCLAFYMYIYERLIPFNRENRTSVLIDEVRIAETPNNVSVFSLKDVECKKERARRLALEQWKSTEGRAKKMAGLQEANKDPVLRQMRSARMIRDNPMSRRDIVDKMLRSLVKSQKHYPNEGEQKLIEFFRTQSIPLSFCGDGSFILDGKIPDFVNYDKKVVVEYNGRFWHSKNEWNDACDDSKERIAHFKKHGYTCYVIWDDEFEAKKKTIVSELKGLLR